MECPVDLLGPFQNLLHTRILVIVEEGVLRTLARCIPQNGFQLFEVVRIGRFEDLWNADAIMAPLAKQHHRELNLCAASELGNAVLDFIGECAKEKRAVVCRNPPFSTDFFSGSLVVI